MSEAQVQRTAKLANGHQIPLIGFGTYQLQGEACKTSIREAIAVGYRQFDTAQFYENETEVGEAIRESGISRSEFFVTTKVYRGFDDLKDLEASVDDSNKALGLDYIDLFLLHSPLMTPERRLSTWGFLNEIVNDGTGRVRAAGVSNFGVAHLRQLAEAGLPDPVANQIEIHPHLPQTAIVASCREQGILVQAYCPLMRGPSSIASLGEGAGWQGKPDRGWNSRALKSVCEKHSATVPTVLISWSLAKGFSPLPKSGSASRIRENFVGGQGIELDEADMALLNSMSLEGEESDEGRVALEWNPTNAL